MPKVSAHVQETKVILKCNLIKNLREEGLATNDVLAVAAKAKRCGNKNKTFENRIIKELMDGKFKDVQIEKQNYRRRVHTHRD